MIRLSIDVNGCVICSLVLVNTSETNEEYTVYRATMVNAEKEEIAMCYVQHSRSVASHELFITALKAFAQQFQLDWEHRQEMDRKKNLELLTYLFQHATTQLDKPSSSHL